MGNTRPQLLILIVCVGVVLVIASFNVANLLLVRASKRGREIAVRAALGAKQVRVVRQMLTESVVLAMGGAALGIPIAFWSLQLFIKLNADNLPRIQNAGLDGTVLGFTAIIALLTSMVFGLVPALRASKPNLTEFLKEGRGTTAGSSHQRLRGALIVVETAIGLALLVVAGLLLRSFHRLLAVDPGLNPRGVLTLTFDLPEKKYSEQQQVDFYRQLLARSEALPGVVSAAAVTPLPLSGGNAIITFQIDGRQVPKAEEPSADIKVVSAGYFHTFAIPFMSGRDFNDHDDSKSPGVVIVNEEFAHRFFPNENAIGKRITPGASNHGEPQPREIVGIVGNVKSRRLDSETVPEYYIPQFAAQLRLNGSLPADERGPAQPDLGGAQCCFFDGPRPAALRHQDHGRIPGGLRGNAAFPCHAAGGICGAGAAADGSWPLWRDCVCGGAAHA